jgi:hypothetical protein
VKPLLKEEGSVVVVVVVVVSCGKEKDDSCDG